MRDRRAERSGCRALDVDVDPLVVVRRIRERLDATLVDGEPLARSEGRADGIRQRSGGVEVDAHAFGPPAT